MSNIVRVAHRRAPYTVIDRRALEDERLGWAARGVLSYLLAKPDDWTLKVEDLQKKGDLGRDGVYSVLKELQRHGYVRRESRRDERGRLRGSVYTVFEVPERSHSPHLDAPCPDEPHTAEPDTAEPDTVEPDMVEPDPAEPRPANPTLPSNHYTKEPVDQVTTTTTERGRNRHYAEDRRGGHSDLAFPRSLSNAEVQGARRKLDGFPAPLAQALLDELAGRLEANAIRGSPLAYLRGLIERASSGDFTPEVGYAIAEGRNCRQHAKAAVKCPERADPPLPPPDDTTPFAQRISQIRARRLRARRGAGNQPSGETAEPDP